MPKITLLSTAYFPPIQYFSSLLSADKAIIEVNDNYIKQSYRNRCKILTSNGVQTLSVPVERGSFHKVALRDLKIDYSQTWQQNHIKTLKTSYNSSAFYEYLADDIETCINSNKTFLLDLNLNILDTITTILEIDVNFELSTDYISSSKDYSDLRESIHPKKESKEYLLSLPPYFQLFANNSSFIPNLSILDLIFNMGMESYSFL